MSPPAAVKHPPAGARALTGRRPSVPLLVGGALLVAAVLAIVVLIPSPHFVNRITFDNPSPYDLDVEVSSGPHEGWMAVGMVEPDGQTDVNQIYDLGDEWLVRYSAQGQVSATVRLTRGELTEDNWHVRVPEAVVAELHAGNVAPQP